MNPVAISEIRDLGGRWVDAELHGDTATLDSLLDAGFLAVGPLGFTLNKSEWLDRHRGDLTYEALSWEPGIIRRYCDVAVTIGTQTSEATYQGNPVPFGRLRTTQIALRRGDRWLLVGLHMSQAIEPPGAS
jgi:hypothetical protein